MVEYWVNYQPDKTMDIEARKQYMDTLREKYFKANKI